MIQYLKKAAKAWARATLNVKKFADAYVESVDEFGMPAQAAFESAYPMFGDREWRRLKLIGGGELLPQFFFKSDFFVNKLLKLNGSMRFQRALVGASRDGRIKVDRGSGPEKVTLEELTRGEEKALALLFGDDEEKLSCEERNLKYRTLIAKINKSNVRHGPAWVIRTANGRTVAHFSRACDMDEEDLEDALAAVRSGMDKVVERTRREKVAALVDAIVKLESLRDEEWDFEERHGPTRDCWDDNTCNNHDELLDDIQSARDAVRDLCRELSGKEDLDV